MFSYINIFIEGIYMDRVKTGIKGLDDLMEGGIPIHHHVAVFGGPGAGKTTFAFEYLYRGAKAGEPGIYVSLEETPEDIINNLSAVFTNFTDIQDLVDAGKLIVAKPDKLDLETVAGTIEQAITDSNVKRAVIDSLTIMKLPFGDTYEYRQTLFELFSLLRNMDCTVVSTLEAATASKKDMKYDIEHFVLDGIINVYNLDLDEYRVRALEIFKMRATHHSERMIPFKITNNGIVVYPDEKVFI